MFVHVVPACLELMPSSCVLLFLTSRSVLQVGGEGAEQSCAFQNCRGFVVVFVIGFSILLLAASSAPRAYIT